MKRKVFAAIVICLLILLAVSASADFGGFSGRSSGSSSRSRHSTSSRRDYTDAERSVVGTADLVFGMIGVSLLAIIGGEIVIIAVGEVTRRRRIKKYLAANPAFERKAFEAYAESLYCDMQVVWQNKDISPLRDNMTEEFFTHMDGVLYPFREKCQTDHTEGIEIISLSLDDAKQKDGIDYLEVYMQANILSYVTDDLTGKIISGDNSYKIRMEYTIKFLRRSGAENSAVWRVYEMTGEKLKYPRHTFRR